MTVYGLRKILANITNQNTKVAIKENHKINYGDNAPIDAVFEEDGVVCIASPKSL